MRWVVLALCLVASLAFARDVGRLEYPNTTGIADFQITLSTPASDTLGRSQLFFPGNMSNPTGTHFAWFVTVGQSRTANVSSAPAHQYSVTNGTHCVSLNPATGKMYIANDPILGASAPLGNFQAGWHGKLCDLLINGATKGYTDVGFIAVAIGGSSVLDWIPSGQFNARMQAAASWLTAMGITPRAWIWQQGLADCAMAGATYQTNLQNVLVSERGFSGRSGDRWMITVDTVSGISPQVTCPAIASAQTTVAGQTNNVAGPNLDSIPVADYDGIHYNDTGNSYVATQYQTAIGACSGCSSIWLLPFCFPPLRRRSNSFRSPSMRRNISRSMTRWASWRCRVTLTLLGLSCGSH